MKLQCKHLNNELTFSKSIQKYDNIIDMNHR